MLFMITQVHSPENCPKDVGGSDVLINKDAKGITLKGRWGAWSNHIIWYLVETDNVAAIQQFLDPGMLRTTCTVTPVADAPYHK
ncbi:MAG: hypothetical protein HYX95_03780 [Chloroflexi bacterium]|nr:hypothetical protein [Chloroflexota bacterium]